MAYFYSEIERSERFYVRDYEATTREKPFKGKRRLDIYLDSCK